MRNAIKILEIPYITFTLPNDSNLESGKKIRKERKKKAEEEIKKELKRKRRKIKNGYTNLHKKATSGPDNQEFTDPKVSALWKLALRSDFDNAELESLYVSMVERKLSYLIEKEDRQSIFFFFNMVR